MTILTIDDVRQIQQNFMTGNRPNVQLTAEQRRLIDEFRPTHQEINEAYAKARQKVEKDGQL